MKPVTHKQLVTAVKSIDKKAAAYLKGEEIKQTPSYGFSGNSTSLTGALSCLFYWDTSPQGNRYWGAICCELEEYDRAREEEEAKEGDYHA